MESNWRMNIATFGEEYNFWELIARLDTVIPPAFNYLAKNSAVDGVFVLSVLFEEVVQLAYLGPVPTDHPRFPWGYAVEPD